MVNIGSVISIYFSGATFKYLLIIINIGSVYVVGIEILGRRGALTPEIQQISKEFLGREITTAELRLMAYIDFVMKNWQKIEPSKVNSEDREVLKLLRSEGHIDGGASGLSITHDYYNYMQKILWIAYVCVDWEQYGRNDSGNVLL